MINLHRSVYGCCPSAALQEYLAVSPSGGSVLFPYHDGSPLMQFQFQVVFQKAIGETGWQHEHFMSHSFLIGAASAAAAVVLGQGTVQALGHWYSCAFL